MTQLEYNSITDVLIKYSESYYNDDVSLVTDREFDELLVKSQYIEKKHPEWIREDSITQKPGTSVNGDKIKHDTEMLSLGNTYTEDELKKWYDDMTAFGAESFVVEFKLDGVSGSIKYKDGKIARGVSRGDGEYGLDMTLNMRMINDLANIKSAGDIEVRGEIMMLNSEFERINALEPDVTKKHANPRNLTSGTLKLLDIDRIKERKLSAFIYWVMDTKQRWHSNTLLALDDGGFNVAPFWIVYTFEEMWDIVQHIEIVKSTLDYEIDGAVIKVNDRELWDKIGYTSKFPKWAKAYKYEPESMVTKVKDVVFQVGRTGKITPVIKLEPVFLSGSTVQSVTLNNESYLKDMDIQIGDYVDVKKAAEIIPFINKVLVERRATDGETRTIIPFPKVCPECGTKLKKLNTEHKDKFCTNEKCPARIVGKIVKYTTDMEIDGFAEIIVEKLHSKGFLSSIPDLYKLHEHKAAIVNVDRMGTKLITRLLKNIEDSKTQKLVKFVHAIGINNVGKNGSKILVKRYGTMKLIMSASYDELVELEDIGDTVANNIVNYFKNPDNSKMILDLVNSFDLEEPVIEDKGDLLELEGKNFCITGALSLKRDDYVELLENMGAKVVSGVSKKTHYLITNATTRTSKFIKAEQLGIPILTEMELLEMCDALHLLKRLTA